MKLTQQQINRMEGLAGSLWIRNFKESVTWIKENLEAEGFERSDIESFLKHLIIETV